jgi:hypothetical protein
MKLVFQKVNSLITVDLNAIPLQDSSNNLIYLSHFTSVEAMWICANLAHADEDAVVKLFSRQGEDGVDVLEAVEKWEQGKGKHPLDGAVLMVTIDRFLVSGRAYLINMALWLVCNLAGLPTLSQAIIDCTKAIDVVYSFLHSKKRVEEVHAKMAIWLSNNLLEYSKLARDSRYLSQKKKVCAIVQLVAD